MVTDLISIQITKPVTEVTRVQHCSESKNKFCEIVGDLIQLSYLPCVPKVSPTPINFLRIKINNGASGRFYMTKGG